MFITKLEFRAFDRDHKDFWVSEAPLMEKAIKDRLKRTVADTSLLQKVVRYEAVELKKIQEDTYDMHGKRVTPDIGD